MRQPEAERGKKTNPRAIAPRPVGASRIRGANAAAARKVHRQHPQVKLACNACRLKKSRCDATRPTCSQCMNRNRTCEYDAAPGQTRAEAVNDRLRGDKASLLEMFWHLRTTSAEEAQEFLGFIRNTDPIDMPLVERWFSQRQKNPDDGQSHSVQKEETSPVQSLPRAETPEAEKFDLVKSQGTPASAPDMSELSDAPQHWSNSLTVSSVKAAVHMFLRSGGMLFYVFTEKQVDELFDKVLPTAHYPENVRFLDVLKQETRAQHHAHLAELCGMAAVGTFYSRPPDKGARPPAEAAEFLYSLTKAMLDNSIEANPLRAMKVCALLAVYSIVLKAVVAITYIELGLGLGRMYGIDADERPPNLHQQEFLDYRRVWRTLFLFSRWLRASLGHVVGEEHMEYHHLPQEEDTVLTGFVIEGQLIKATMMKAAIIRKMGDNHIADDATIETLRKALRTFHQEIPSTFTIDSLFDVRRLNPLRPNIFYLHLFYLSSMQLLHRRVMAHQPECSESEPAKESIREGLQAAKMTARLLALMRFESDMVQLCWICIYTSYTSAIIILQAAVQKILNGFPSITWASDLKLVDACVEVVGYCSQVDVIAGGLEKRICRYTRIVQDAVAGEDTEDLPDYTEEGTSLEYLFHIPEGSTDLHRAARDLLHLVQKPFSNSLELISDTIRSDFEMRATLVNWAEAAMGSTYEWAWELQQCELSQDPGTDSAKIDFLTIEIMSKLSLGRLTSNGDMPWARWTPPPS